MATSTHAHANCASLTAVAIPTHPLCLLATPDQLAPIDRFIVDRLPIALRIARHRARYAPEFWPDLFQEACVALVEVVRAVAPCELPLDVTHLEAQAIGWMRHRVTLALAWHCAGAYSVPLHALRDWVRVRQLQQAMQQSGQSPSPAELAERLHLPTARIAHLLALTTSISSLTSADPSVAAADLTPTSYLDQRVRDLIAQLGEPERTIIAANFGIGTRRIGLRALSAQLGLSARHVIHCRERALGMLRTWLSEDMA